MNLFDIDSSTKYWVVRAGAKAIFYNQFLTSKCIAMEHMDNISFDSVGVLSSDVLPEIEKRIIILNSKLETPEGSRQMSARLGQIRHFIEDFSIGDVIFTLSPSQIAIGTIISDAYIDTKPLHSFDKQGDKVESKTKQILRRNVKWEKKRLRSTLPAPISKSLGAQKTLFSLDSHQELLKHWLYGIYIENNELHFTTEINQTDDIAQFHLTEFQRIVQKLELFSLIKLDERSFDLDTINDLYYDFGGKDKFTLTNKSIFTSPGHSWGKIKGDRATLIAFSFLMAGCMGETINPLDDEDKEIINSNLEQLTKAIDHINSNTTLDSHISHLEALISKPNKDKFVVDDSTIKNPDSEATISPYSSDEETSEEPETTNSPSELDDKYDFPDISEDGDVGL